MGDRDRQLLDDLVRQAGPAAYAARIQAAIRRWRERLVSTREEERRRLRRDLHDGLGRVLAGTRPSSRRHKPRCRPARIAPEGFSSSSRAETLDLLGLAGALRERAAHFSAGGGLRLEVLAPDELPPRANVVHHARAGCCWLRLELNGEPEREHGGDLRVEVRDDGIGLDAAARAGVGLRSMRERADELGGSLSITADEKGTVIVARLPTKVA